MQFIHTVKFTRAAAKIFTEAELAALEDWLDLHPDSGDIIRGSGGCRKMRWGARQRGKRGGARVIYFYRISASQIRFMRAYAKSEKTDLTPAEIKQLKQETGEIL